MTVDTIQCEMWLLGWNEHHKRGATITVQLSPEDLEAFKSLTIAKGKTAGQRFMAVLALIADDESPEKLPAGPLCKLAAIWCRDRTFSAWVGRIWPTLLAEFYADRKGVGISFEESAKHIVCTVCGIQSRKELDHNAEARRTFTDLIRKPYMAYLHGNGSD